MASNITMPALSPTMEEGNLVKWLVKEGDSVSPGDIIAEIETDKATMEVEAVDEGVIAKILVAEGTEGVKVNAVIAVLAEEGEDVTDTVPDVVSSPDPEGEKSPEVAKGGNDSSTQPKSTRDAISQPPSVGETDISPSSGETGGGARIFASPLARRIASQNNIDLATIKGSGPHGRIIKRDLENVSVTEIRPILQPATVTIPADMVDNDVLKLYAEGSYEILPHDNMRKVIARRLLQSTQTIPAYFLSMDCQLDAMLDLRKQINDAAAIGEDEKPVFKISVNDFIIKAMALALRDIPLANASWTSNARLVHKHCDVGVAVAIPDGLITPIVRMAEIKTLSVISNEMKDLASRARNRKLKPEEFLGGSTAVSNLGMFGVSDFTSIINPPHASIISIGAGEKRPVVIDGESGIATVMSVTFAFDHRVIDGALGAQLASAFKNHIEKPTGMLV